jgi:hypothetical protein
MWLSFILTLDLSYSFASLFRLSVVVTNAIEK